MDYVRRPDIDPQEIVSVSGAGDWLVYSLLLTNVKNVTKQGFLLCQLQQRVPFCAAERNWH
jgi:hypothetical protein